LSSKANEYIDKERYKVVVGREQQKEFDELKRIFTTRLVLAALD